MSNANGLPYYKAYPRDFIEGTMGMSLELKGAYRVLLDLIYMRRGRLVDDPRYIAGVLGCSVRKWSSLRDQLIAAGKIALIDGTLRNHRADIEVESLRKLSDKQRVNRSGSRKNKDLVKPRFDQPEPEPEPEPERAKSSPSSPERPARAPAAAGAIAEKGAALDDPTLRELILTACGADPVSGLVGPSGVMLGSRADMHTVDRWRCDLGLPDDVIIAVVRDTMDRKRDGPPSRLSYFDRPMQAEAAARNKPKLEPNNEPVFRRSNLGASGLSARTGADGFPPGPVGVAMRRAAARRAQIEGKV